MKITLLGTGTSQGVPVIACNCRACRSSDQRDKRLRCSVHVETNQTNLIIDVGPDFRQQALTHNLTQLDAVLLTHEHNDHVAGMDDLRPFIFRQKQDMPVYGMERVLNAIRERFPYAFEDHPYPGIPRFDLQSIQYEEFTIGNMSVQPIQVMHGSLPILGFRIGDFSYVTDALTITESEKEKLRNSKILVINALQVKPHYSHLNLEGALELIQELKPESTYLTHISHLMGKTESWKKNLPHNVFPAYDGLLLEV